jgi:hypothetical protein
MRIPPYPVKGGSVEATIRELIDYVRTTTITSVAGGRLKVRSNGTALDISTGGGTAGKPTLALTLVTTRPSYIPAGTAVAVGMNSIWVTWGFANERLPTNWHHRLDVPITGDYTKYIYLKINFAGDSEALVVTTCNWETFSFPAVTPPWGANGARPAYFYVLLGTVTSGGLLPEGVHVVNNGGGSIQVGEYLSKIVQNGATGFTYQKTFSIQRFPT